MGSLKLPASGTVYVDSNCVIYAVEKVRQYATVLDPLWRAAVAGSVSIMSSQIVVLEVLAKPIREKKVDLQRRFRQFLLESDQFITIPIGLPILERAAHIRAETGLRTPDAVHAATALEQGAALFVTNDRAFRRVSGLPVIVLSEILGESAPA